MTTSEFLTFDPYVLFEDDLTEDECFEPTLDTAEGEALLLGVTQYS